MKIYVAGFLANAKDNLSKHFLFNQKKTNRMMSYYDIKENRSYSKDEFKI